MKSISSIEQLEALYASKPSERALWKEIDHINPHYQAFIEHSPFLIIASHGEKGVDCSPRGDPGGFVRIVNERCIHIPDRRGNNRLDTLRNIVQNPNIGIIFLIPGIGETIRISGKANIIVDADLNQSFAINNKAASSVINVEVEKVYFQCQKAIARSELWNPEKHVKRDQLPSAGQMSKAFAAAQNIDFDGDTYDKTYPGYMKETIY